MKLTIEKTRRRLERMKPILTRCSLSAARAGQTAIGQIMSLPVRRGERFQKIRFPRFDCGLITPRTVRDPEAAILYLHGGGYVGGGLEYARGFGSVLAAETGLRVFFPAYRLAPEHPFPAALQDALIAYRYLVRTCGIAPEKLVLCGESAGGGLIFSLCLALKRLGKPLPAGLAAISPWTDLTVSGPSYAENEANDPSITKEQLAYYASCYAKDPTDPLVSPLFGDPAGLPPTLLFSGGDEIMLSDAAGLHQKLLEAGCESRHIVAPGLWHVYLIYDLDERKDDRTLLRNFIWERIHETNPSLDAAR